SPASSSAHTPDIADSLPHPRPFMPHSRSHSNVAETGSLRSLRAGGGGSASHPVSPSIGVAAVGASDLALVGLKNAHVVLKRAFLDTPRLPAESSAEARRELQAIAELAQSMLMTFDQVAI
ncbi:hypothetical protein IWW38_005480, partial [Coemansia aciculifera]